MISIFKPEQQQRLQHTGRILTLVAGIGMIVSAYLKWSYGADALDDMTYWGGPSTLQFLFLAMGVVLVLAAVCGHLAGGRTKKLGRVAWNRGAKSVATAALVYALAAVIFISLELGGLVNVEPGGWVAVVVGVLGWLGTRMLPAGADATLSRVRSRPWLQIVAIVVLLALGLLAFMYGLGQSDGGGFVLFVVFVFAVLMFLTRSGVMAWCSRAGRENRRVLILAAFVVAFALPFTQDGSDANMSVATQVLIFAATALGLNIVVGLAGLLDLGYIAFLGAGAFTAAVLSESAFATFVTWKPPFIVVMLISGLVSGCLGLIIGSPTLRVSGDYLAIVTLAFGEIFRLGMLNLDGSDGPDIIHGSNGIPNIPDLQVGSYDLGQPHTILGVEIGRFANYYWLMLLILALIILVFANLNRSRIGRGWVAIREDEKAAEAMGVNVFGLKLLAFAGGAFLAGLAGSVKAHADISATPDQYIFLESAFLLAAVVLGGMGTIVGVLAGATILKMLPEKLRVISDYRLLMFGILLVVMMRFRPEGLVPDERRQLEFHEDDEELASEIDELSPHAVDKEGITG